jgi:hypothetical protein
MPMRLKDLYDDITITEGGYLEGTKQFGVSVWYGDIDSTTVTVYQDEATIYWDRVQQ